MMNKISQKVVIALVIFMVFGCSAPLKQTRSGFLGDYSQLKDAKNVDNTQVYFSHEFTPEFIASIKDIELSPFEIWLTQPADKGTVLLKSTTLGRIGNYIHRELQTKLSQQFSIVDTAGSQGIVIRGAFTDIKIKDPELSVSDFVPVRVVLNAGNSVYLELTEQKDVITEVSIEVEFVSGKSGKRVFAMTATKELDLTVSNQDNGFEAVAQVIDVWVDNFVTKLSQAKNKSN